MLVDIPPASCVFHISRIATLDRVKCHLEPFLYVQDVDSGKFDVNMVAEAGRNVSMRLIEYKMFKSEDTFRKWGLLSSNAKFK